MNISKLFPLVVLAFLASNHTLAAVSETSKPISREFSNYKSLKNGFLLNSSTRTSIKTHGLEIKWQKIESESPCREIVDKLADWFFPFSFTGIAGEGLISCYTSTSEKFLFIKLIVEASSESNLQEFNRFLAEREKVAIYGLKIQFRQAWAVVSSSVIKAGEIPGDGDSWSITKFIQEDRTTKMYPNYGQWMAHWYNFLSKSGGSTNELIEAVSVEFSPALAEYYRTAILPQVNGVITQPDATLVFDQMSFTKPDGGVFFVHDCRSSLNGSCSGTSKIKK